MKKNISRFVWVNGNLKEVRRCWMWLFNIFNIGFKAFSYPSVSFRHIMKETLIEDTKENTSLKDVLKAAETYNRKCEIYLNN